MKKFSILLVLTVSSVIFLSSAFAQSFSIQGNNEMRMATGKEFSSQVEVDREYFENRLNLDGYYGNFRLGSRLTLLRPSELYELRPADEVLEKIFLEYSHPDGYYNFKAGDFYTTWGRGLTLALQEDIVQGFDSGLRGVLAGINYKSIEFEALTGNSREDIQGLVLEGQVTGAHVETALPGNFTLGAQGVMIEPAADDEVTTYLKTDSYGAYAAYDGSLLSFWLEHMMEEVEGIDEDFDATYASVSSYFGSVGIALDYKNYNYYKGSSESVSGNSASKPIPMLPYHNPPIVQREFTSNLFGKHPHIVRYNDEVGLQLEITYALGSAGMAILAMSQSSVHEEEDSWLPTLNEEDSPYREMFLEFNAYPASEIYLVSWLGYSEEVEYSSNEAFKGTIGWEKRQAFGSKVELPGFWMLPSEKFSSLIYAEGLLVDDVKNDETHSEGLFTLGLIYNSNSSLTVSYEFTNEDEPDEGRDNWLNIQATTFIKQRHELTVMYGRERGGLVCTSGKCRLVNPFNGLKVSLVTLF